MPAPPALASVTVPPVDLAKLDRLAAALQAAGAKDLQKELADGLRRGVRRIPRELRRAALGRLPFHGGLAEDVANGMRFRTRVSVGRNPSLSIRGSWPGHDVAALNRGRARHPVFGNRKVWRTTTVKPGFWDDGGALGAQDVTPELVKAIDNVARKLKASI
jgi:hypothetical protein